MILVSQVLSRRQCFSLGAFSILALQASCRRTTAQSTQDAGITLPSGWTQSLWPQVSGARRAFAAVSNVSLTEVVVHSHDLLAELSVPAGSLSLLMMAVAGLRGELIDPAQSFVCNGARCERAHGSIRPSDALALGCRTFFSNIAPRLGAVSLAAAFSVFGLRSIAVSEDPESRMRLALHGTGWNLNLPDALLLAQQLREQQHGRDVGFWSEACVPRGGAVGALRGVVASEESSAWFVGWAQLTVPKLLAVFVTDCSERAGSVVLQSALSLVNARVR